MSQSISYRRCTSGISALSLWLVFLNAPTAAGGGKADSKTKDKIGVDPIPRVSECCAATGAQEPRRAYLIGNCCGKQFWS